MWVLSKLRCPDDLGVVGNVEGIAGFPPSESRFFLRNFHVRTKACPMLGIHLEGSNSRMQGLGFSESTYHLSVEQHVAFVDLCLFLCNRVVAH